MRLWGVLVVVCLLAPALSACLGPPNAQARSEPARFRPYMNNVTVPVEGIEEREPVCSAGPPANCTEFYVLRIIGSENATLVSGPDVLRECASQPRWLFDVDAQEKTIAYNASYYDEFPKAMNTLVAQDFRGVVFGEKYAIQGCPSSYGLFAYGKTPPPSHVKILGNYGVLNATVFRFGNVVVNKEMFFNLGEKLVVSYGTFRVIGTSTYFVQGGFEVVNLGPWPIESLRPGEAPSPGPS